MIFSGRLMEDDAEMKATLIVSAWLCRTYPKMARPITDVQLADLKKSIAAGIRQSIKR